MSDQFENIDKISHSPSPFLAKFLSDHPNEFKPDSVLFVSGNFLDILESDAEQAKAIVKAELNHAELLFINAHVNIDDEATYKRLARLGQSFGIPIVYINYEKIPYHIYNDGRVIDYDFGIIHPPVGKSIEDFWKQVKKKNTVKTVEVQPAKYPAFYNDILGLLDISSSPTPDYDSDNPMPGQQRAYELFQLSLNSIRQKLYYLSILDKDEREYILNSIGRDKFVDSLFEKVQFYVRRRYWLLDVALNLLRQVDEEKLVNFTLGLIENFDKEIPDSFTKDDIFTHIAFGVCDCIKDKEEQNPQRQNLIKALRKFAFKRGDKGSKRIVARNVLAQLGDQWTLDRVLKESRDIVNQKNSVDVVSPINSIGEILAIYLKQNEVLANQIVERVNELASKGEYGEETHILMSALMFSGRIEAVSLISNLLNNPAKNEDFEYGIAFPIFLYIKRFAIGLQKGPDCAEKDAALEEIGDTLDTFIKRRRNNRQDLFFQYKIPFRNIGELISEALLVIGSKEAKELAKIEVIKLFRLYGGLIEDVEFQYAYLKYMEKYGNIPEIDQYITIRE